MATYQDVLQAHKRIKDFIHKTPVVRNETFDKLSGKSVFFKCENLQKTGSFKARGALNAVCIYFTIFYIFIEFVNLQS